MTEETKTKTKNWYERNYKLLLIIPAALLILSAIYLYNFNAQHGDLIYKDVSLTGGTTLTILDSETDVAELREKLILSFPDVFVREISDIRTRKQQAVLIESSASPDALKSEVEKILGYQLNTENSSVEFSGSALSAGFYQQLRLAILIAFFFMAIVVFFIFRTPIPSIAVIISAFADIVMTIAVVDLIGISLSTAGVVALLMLIGYSVDTDILLTTRLIRQKEGTLNKRTIGAFKTGITMTLTSIAAILVAFIIIFNFSDVLRQMFTILLIGLGFDLLNTWITNASILRWYVEKKGGRL